MQYFISATGTNIGKTKYLCHLLQSNKGHKAIKPIISGFDENDIPNSDTGKIALAMGLDLKTNLDNISPFRFSTQTSPDIAMKKENRFISFEEIVKFCEKSNYNYLEGAGGLLSPITTNKTNLDLALKLNLPIILVCGNYLGSISHILAHIIAARSRGGTIDRIVINQYPDPYYDVTDFRQSLISLEPHLSDKISLLM